MKLAPDADYTGPILDTPLKPVSDAVVTHTASSTHFTLHIKSKSPFPFLTRKSDQMLIKPRNSLVERLFLGPLLHLVRQIAADGEPVAHAGVQVDLVRQLGLPQDLLRLVALLSGEYVVRLCGCDGQGSGDGGELILLDERRVGDEADLDTVFVVADDVLLGGVLVLRRLKAWWMERKRENTFAPKQ